MKQTLQHWLIPVCICSLLGVVVFKGEHWVRAQSQATATQEASEVEPQEHGDDDTDAMDAPGDEPSELEDSEPNEDVMEEPEDGDEVRSEDSDSNDSEKVNHFESKTEELVSQIHEAISNKQSEQAKQLKEELKNVTRDYFELLESQRRTQIASLERKLETLRQVLEAREQNADQIVQRRVKKLLGESDTLDWNPRVEVKETWRSRTAKRNAELSVLDAMYQLGDQGLTRNSSDTLPGRVSPDMSVRDAKRLPPLEALKRRDEAISLDKARVELELERTRLSDDKRETLENSLSRLKAERDKLKHEFETLEKRLKEFQ